MLVLKPVCTHRFDGVVALSDVPSELHDGLRGCVDDTRFTEPAGDQGHCISLDFEGTLLDTTPEPIVRDMLRGVIGWSAYPMQNDTFDKFSMPPVAYAALLLATRHLRERLPPNVVVRDNVAILIPLLTPAAYFTTTPST